MSEAPRAATPLKRQLLRGTAWVAASRFLGNGLSFVLTLLLARLLTPEDFGVVALCVVIVGLLQQFYDAGVGEALVAIPTANERAQRTALSLALATSASVSLLTALSNPALGWLAGDARVGPAVAVLSLSLPFQSIGIVPRSLLRREFAMKKEGVGFVARSGGELIIAPSLALLGFGYWSIIIARLAGSVIECGSTLDRAPVAFRFCTGSSGSAGNREVGHRAECVPNSVAALFASRLPARWKNPGRRPARVLLHGLEHRPPTMGSVVGSAEPPPRTDFFRPRRRSGTPRYCAHKIAACNGRGYRPALPSSRSLRPSDRCLGCWANDGCLR